MGRDPTVQWQRLDWPAGRALLAVGLGIAVLLASLSVLSWPDYRPSALRWIPLWLMFWAVLFQPPVLTGPGGSWQAWTVIAGWAAASTGSLVWAVRILASRRWEARHPATIPAATPAATPATTPRRSPRRDARGRAGDTGRP